MRFVCDSCHAQYMISDDKVGARGVKVRCKKCSHVIVVRREGMEGHSGSSTTPSPEIPILTPSPLESVPPQPGKPFLDGLGDDEMGALFDQALGNSPKPALSDDELIQTQLGGGNKPGDTESTRVMDLDAMKQLAAASGREESSGAAASTQEWFVAINEKQNGPLAVQKVKELWDRGEITGDSLTWRAGMADWLPLSEVPELGAILAPRPSRPLIVSPAPMSTPSPVMTIPVESAFNAGGVSRTVRSEVPVMASGSKAEGGWRPTAASALAALAKDEIESFKKPVPAKSAATETHAAGLLDIPTTDATGRMRATAQQAPAAPSAAHAMVPGTSNGHATPGGYSAYAPRRARPLNRTVALLVGGVVVMLLILVATVTYLWVSRGQDGREVATRPSTQAPTQVAVAPLPAPTNPAPVVTSPPPVKSPEPATAAPVPVSAPTAISPKASDITSPNAKHSRLRHPKPGSADPAAAPVSTGSKGTTAVVDIGDGDFEKEFAAAGKPPPEKRRKEPGSEDRQAVYVPPEPGRGKEELEDGDIMQVVLNNKPGILRCVDEQKKKDPGSSGKLVMHWNISPNGRTSGVTVAPQSAELKSTFLAGCISSLVKGFKFPAHKVPHAPVDFPFTF